MPTDAAPPMAVVLALAWAAGEVREQSLLLPAGATLADALGAAGLAADTDAGIWGKPRPGDTRLQPGDRVEVYRALRVDPKVARRERFKVQGARATGLFARKD